MAKSEKTTAARGRRGEPFDLGDLGRALVEAWIVNERMNQLLLEHLDSKTWNAPQPLAKKGSGRTIAAIVSHVHNVRHMWLVVSAKGSPAPPKLERASVTIAQARAALARSSEAMRGLFEVSLANGGPVKNAGLDVAAFLAYAIAHEAHHRGQILLLAKQLGAPISKDAGYAMWDWRKRRQDCGLELR
jgi:uncharacterized damage-inducible protein DinB